MTYLILEMLLCLLIAFLLGLLVGWWLGRNRRRERLDRLEEKWRLKHEHARKNLEDCRRELAACQERVDAGPAAVEPTEDEAPAEPAEGEATEDEAPAAPEEAEAAAEPRSAAVSAAATAAAALADVPPAEPDDLKKIEGIGPKIEGLLNAGGIVTWAQLAVAEIDRLQSILDDAGPRYRVHDPATWPQQAELAATGRWDELEELQDRLKGGRKT